jgi:hypothetical protein
MAKRISEVSDLTPDSRNANRGTQRGAGLLEKSLEQYGAGRSILTDRDGNVIAGNKTLETAARMGLPIKTVRSDGTHLVVVQRVDLDIDSPEARELAIADNRISEVSLAWDDEILLELDEEIDLSKFFLPDELATLRGLVPDPGDGDQGPEAEKCPTCGARIKGGSDG